MLTDLLNTNDMGGEGDVIATSVHPQKIAIVINKKDFLKSLIHMQSVVEKRNIISILSHVMIIAKNNELQLTATDMDIVVSERIAATVHTECEFTVDAVTICDIVKKLDDKDEIKIAFEANSSQIGIYSGQCSFVLSVLPTKDFPKLDDMSYDSSFKINGCDLKSILDKCKFVIPSEKVRYNLNGIYMHRVDNMLVFVATDGHRLNFAQSTDISELGDFSGVIIPKKTVIEITNLLDDVNSEILISISANKIKFNNENLCLTSKLVDAKFPDYDRFIPKDNHITLELNRTSFDKSIDRVSSILNEKFRGIKITLEGTSLTITSNSENGGYAKEEMQISGSFDKFEIGFNFKYILEILNSIGEDSIELSLKDPFSPAMITGKGNYDFKYIIMPMRVFS